VPDSEAATIVDVVSDNIPEGDDKAEDKAKTEVKATA
jgi:hypothetical protein